MSRILNQILFGPTRLKPALDRHEQIAAWDTSCYRRSLGF
jgi:hypothetical protein